MKTFLNSLNFNSKTSSYYFKDNFIKSNPCQKDIKGNGRELSCLSQRNQVIVYSFRLKHLAFPVEIDEEDLKQYADRARWYEAKWCAIDQPEWNAATVVDTKILNTEMKLVVLETEVSREKVALRNAYKDIGQRACIRVGNSAEQEVTVAIPPFPSELNKQALLNVRGDLFANQEKAEIELLSVKANLEVIVTEEEFPELFATEEGDSVEVGPYKGTGLKLRGPILGIYRYSTVVIFCCGKGVATARALIEATSDVSSLNIPLRANVSLYYKAQNEASFIFKDKFPEWEKIGCNVFTTTESFQDAFDEDSSLVYEPTETAAILLSGGDEEMEKEMLKVCKEAEISLVIKDSEEQEEVEYVVTGDLQTMGWKWEAPDDILKDLKTKPFTVPEGWKPPTIAEQFKYAYERHPYYRYGYALVLLTGIGAYVLLVSKKDKPIINSKS